MPGLVHHAVVDYARLFDREGDIVKHLRVPALIQPVDAVFADDVEVVFVLRHHEVVLMQIIYEFVQHEVEAEFAQVEQQHAGVEEIVARDAQRFFDVVAEHVRLDHDLLVAGADVRVADVGEVQIADIALHDGVAVNIYRFVVLGEHFGNEQAVIRGFRIVVAQRQSVPDRRQIFRHVAEADDKILVLQPPERRLHLGRDPGVQHEYAVLIIAGGVLLHRK